MENILPDRPRLRPFSGEHEPRNIALENQLKELLMAIDALSQGFSVFDSRMILIASNRRFATMYGLLPEQIRPGMSLSAILDLRAELGNDPKMSYEEYVSWTPSTPLELSNDWVVELRNGRKIAIRNHQLENGGVVATHDDITDRVALEERIRHLAGHDPLTGLPNRTLFLSRLQAALASVVKGQGCALLYVDIDRFKQVNDTFGHPRGDALLAAIAARLRTSIREMDVAARFGGDEFVVLHSGTALSAINLGDRLIRELGACYQIDGVTVTIGTSIGIAFAPKDGIESDQLIQRADFALLRAKHKGRGGIRAYGSESDSACFWKWTATSV